MWINRGVFHAFPYPISTANPKVRVSAIWLPMHVHSSGPVRVLRGFGGLIVGAHTVAAFGYMARKGGLTVKSGTLALLLLLAFTAQVHTGLLWAAVEARYILSALAAGHRDLRRSGFDRLMRRGYSSGDGLPGTGPPMNR